MYSCVSENYEQTHQTPDAPFKNFCAHVTHRYFRHHPKYASYKYRSDKLSCVLLLVGHRRDFIIDSQLDPSKHRRHPATHSEHNNSQAPSLKTLYVDLLYGIDITPTFVPRMMRQRESLMVKTDNIFQLTKNVSGDDASSSAAHSTDDTASPSSPSVLAFPSAATNIVVSTLGFLSWGDDEQASPEDEQPRLDISNLKVCGRKEEIKTLQDAFDRIRVGHAEVVTLFGEAGSGKVSDWTAKYSIPSLMNFAHP